MKKTQFIEIADLTNNNSAESNFKRSISRHCNRNNIFMKWNGNTGVLTPTLKQ